MARFVLSAFADEASESLEGQIKALQRNDIDYIEPRNIHQKSVSYCSPEELALVKSTLDEAGIRVSSLGSPIGKYPVSSPFEDHLTQFRMALRAAAALGTKRMRVFSFFCQPDEKDDVRDEVIRRLKIMIDESKAAGIVLCHENEASIYGEEPSRVRDLLENLPELGGIFDPANCVMGDCDPWEGYLNTEPHLSYLHIKDALFNEKAIVPAGEGDGQIGRILRRVDEMRDDVIYLSVEPHLKLFGAYHEIDKRTLRGKYVFSGNDESFDYAVTALKRVLSSNGFVRNAHNEWVKQQKQHD